MRFGLRTLLVVLGLAPLVAGGLLGAFNEPALEIIETRYLILTTIWIVSLIGLIVGDWWWGKRRV